MSKGIDQVLKDYEGLVVRIATKKYRIEFSDELFEGFLAAGREGLIKACETYDYKDPKAKFSTYAYNYIVGEMSKLYKKYLPDHKAVAIEEDVESDKQAGKEESMVYKEKLANDYDYKDQQKTYIEDLISYLDDQSQQVLLMSYGIDPYFGEYKPDDIAKEMELKSVQVEQIHHEAIKQLKLLQSDQLTENYFKIIDNEQTKNIPFSKHSDDMLFDKKDWLYWGSGLFFQYFPDEVFKIKNIEYSEERELHLFLWKASTLLTTNLDGTLNIELTSDINSKVAQYVTFVRRLKQFQFGKVNKGSTVWRKNISKDGSFINSIDMGDFVRHHAPKLMKFQMRALLTALEIPQRRIREYLNKSNLKFKKDLNYIVLEKFNEYIERTGHTRIKFSESENKLGISVEDIRDSQKNGYIEYPFYIYSGSEELVRLM